MIVLSTKSLRVTVDVVSILKWIVIVYLLTT